MAALALQFIASHYGWLFVIGRRISKCWMLDAECWMLGVAQMIAGTSAAIILAALGAVHVYWALGGKVGKGSAIPTRDGVPVLCPGILGTLFVAAVLFAMAALLATRTGWFPLSAFSGATRTATWLVAAVFGLRAIGDFRYIGFLKSVRDSRFARLDTLIYSPLCVLLALLSGLAALS